jgi:hypothetical protein
MCSRWKAGQSLHQIGRSFGKSHVFIHFLLAQRGDCSGSSSALAGNTHTDRARRYLSRDRFQFVDS